MKFNAQIWASKFENIDQLELSKAIQDVCSESLNISPPILAAYFLQLPLPALTFPKQLFPADFRFTSLHCPVFC